MLMPKVIIWVFKTSDPYHNLPYSGFSTCLPPPLEFPGQLRYWGGTEATLRLPQVPRQVMPALPPSPGQGPLIILFIFNL